MDIKLKAIRIKKIPVYKFLVNYDIYISIIQIISGLSSSIIMIEGDISDYE